VDPVLLLSLSISPSIYAYMCIYIDRCVYIYEYVSHLPLRLKHARVRVVGRPQMDPVFLFGQRDCALPVALRLPQFVEQVVPENKICKPINIKNIISQRFLFSQPKSACCDSFGLRHGDPAGISAAPLR